MPDWSAHDHAATSFCLQSLRPDGAFFAGAARLASAQVTAADALDRPSLRAFVERARAHAQALLDGATEHEAYEFFDREFRLQGEWREGPIYTGVILAEGPRARDQLLPRGRARPEGRNLWYLQDKNGVYIVRELIAKASTDFVEYYYGNPDVIGDENDGSLKWPGPRC